MQKNGFSHFPTGVKTNPTSYTPTHDILTVASGGGGGRVEYILSKFILAEKVNKRKINMVGNCKREHFHDTEFFVFSDFHLEINFQRRNIMFR